MKYGIYNAYWTREWSSDYKYYIQKVKQLGFDILEISCAALQSDYTEDKQLLELKKCAEENGVILTAGYGPTKEQNICSPDPEVVKRAMQFFTNLIPKLHLMDIKILGGGLYSYWPLDMALPMDKEADTERAIQNMRVLAKVAEEYDVTLGMEVLNRYEGYMLNTCEEALRFVDAVGSTHVKVMLDTFHMNIEEDNMAAAIRMAGDKLGHLHLGEPACARHRDPAVGGDWSSAARHRLPGRCSNGTFCDERWNDWKRDQGLAGSGAGCR